MAECCVPRSSRLGPGPEDVLQAVERSFDGQVFIEAGPFLMGSTDVDGYPQDGEGPVREVDLPAFWIDATAVTVADFAEFVEATGYVTTAERWGWSYVFEGFVDHAEWRRSNEAPWWVAVSGATWRSPEGPGSSVEDRFDHPVTHVSHMDASAFAGHVGKRLPSEAEWEKAARGGLTGRRYPWGDELRPNGEWRCNIWQGDFPWVDTGDDGHVGTAPVDVFPPNGFGLYNSVGNVWEWCQDPFAMPGTPPRSDEVVVVRGGSYLCHDSYCNRYRVAARTGTPRDSSTGHVGFRCASSA
jgi:formylglycine-generating enzyme required for sulfatase activity